LKDVAQLEESAERGKKRKQIKPMGDITILVWECLGSNEM
jgi:hypothetical protein